MIKRILYKIAHTKQLLSYASGWFGMVGMPLLIVDLIQTKLALINIQISFVLLFICSIIVLVIFGYVCERIGLIKSEANWSWKQQEEMQKSLLKTTTN